MVRRCKECDRNIARQEAFVVCDACKSPFHANCTALIDAEIDLMASNNSKLKWYCVSCDSQVADVLSNLEKFKKYTDEIRKIRNDMENKMKDFDSRIKCLETRENSSVTREANEDITGKIASYEEQLLIEKKKNNLIYFHLPESNDPDIDQRIKHDYDLFKKLYSPSDVSASDILNIYRVGKKTERVRPLVVKFKDPQTKEKYGSLTFGKRLSIRVNNESIHIPATHDRTKSQREEYKKLTTELKRRNDAEPDANYVIRNKRIVPNFPNAPSGTRTTWASIVSSLN